jgi:hypothetical protein
VGVAASGRRGAGGADFQFDRVSAEEPSLDSAQQHSRQLGDVDGDTPRLMTGPRTARPVALTCAVVSSPAGR